MLAVARDKKGNAARRATRNFQGRFMNKPTIDLFAFPPEIRAIIYTYYFVYETPNRTKRTIQQPKSSLKSKLALLRTSKATQAEAKPFFYRYNVFHFPMPMPETSYSLIRPNGLITSVQLNDPDWGTIAFDNYRILETDHSCLQTFLQHLPNLRFLRLGFETYYGRLAADHPLARSDSQIGRTLTELWQRLNRLEVYMEYPRDSTYLQFNMAIVSDFQWTLEASGAAASRLRWERAVWVLQRARKLSNVP